MNKSLEDLYVDIEAEYPAYQPILTQKDIPVMSRGSLSLISGKPKSRKTFFVASLVAAIIGKEPQLGLKSDAPHKVIWIDTEQSMHLFKEGIKRSLRMAGVPETKNDPMLIPLSFSSISTEDRSAKLEEAIKKHKPEVVIIDGIRDLMYDFNDIKETATLKDLIISLYQTYDLHICCVIHQNKADCNARGHLGSELTNKAETVFSLQSVDDKTIVSPVQCRNRPFSEFAFVINDKEETEKIHMYKVSRKKSRLAPELRRTFAGKEELRYSEISTILQEDMKISKKTAEKYISLAIKEDLIVKNDNDKYTPSKMLIDEED